MLITFNPKGRPFAYMHLYWYIYIMCNWMHVYFEQKVHGETSFHSITSTGLDFFIHEKKEKPSSI